MILRTISKVNIVPLFIDPQSSQRMSTNKKELVQKCIYMICIKSYISENFN